MWLFLLFIAVPIVEIALFIKVGGFLGVWPTICIIILTAVLGTTLVKQQGLAVIQQIKNEVIKLNDPTEAIAHGALILISGVLLLTPGFFTDFIGFILMIPKVRTVIYFRIRSRFELKGFSHKTGKNKYGEADDFDVIDADYYDKDN